MKIKLLSDLHHEFFEDTRLYDNPEKADVVVLAGDIAVGVNNTIYALERFADNHEHVIYVPGNHEYYGRDSMKQFDQELSEYCEGNIHFLNPGHITINGQLFIGATLWTDFRKDPIAVHAANDLINDFRTIDYSSEEAFTPQKAIKLYDYHLEYIRKFYEENCVIVTHFLPAVEAINNRYSKTDLLSKYFASDNADEISYMKCHWLFGHTHDAVDLQINDARLIANPYGYNRNNSFKPKIIEL